MSKAYELNLSFDSKKNGSLTTSIKPYTFVRLSTTEGSVRPITTKGDCPYGVAQELIPGGVVGKIAVCANGGITRIKMSGTALTTAYLNTTSILIGANASGNAVRISTSTSFIAGSPLTTMAASDIGSIVLRAPCKSKL